jgi:hypothetical protein
MSQVGPIPDSPTELRPQVLYRVDGGHAHFATWRLANGHEALALFTTEATAGQYRGDLADASAWTIYQPPRDKLVEVLKTCHAAGIRYAALDPLAGSAKTLFDIPQVLAAANR